MADLKLIGNCSEAMVIARLVSSGKPVLLPFGDNQRYDIVFDDGGSFKRVQTKTGRIKRGAVEFPVCSVNRDTAKKRTYKGEVDFFGVYCPENDTVYLVPAEKCGSSSMRLRVDMPKNNQASRVNIATDFILR